MDAIDDLLSEVLRLPDHLWAPGIDELCARHGEHSVEIRRRFSVLRELGLETVEPITPPADHPERLGDFRLEERLGGGGMGVVYLAEQVSLQRRVALKLVRPELLYFPKAKDRFRREVETVAKLSHPGIVAIHAVGEEQGLPFFAMEHVAGISLEQVLAQLGGRVPELLTGADLAALLGGSSDDLFDGSWLDTCVRIARKVAEALAHAHARGVVHRDVKPSNVMLTREGRVVLLDFGLALVQHADRVTRTGVQLGSLPYMAPEQVRGEHDRVDARSDVYSLGVTLYELLTLRSPFEAATAESTRQNILVGAPPPLRVVNRRVSTDVAIVCGTAMDLDPRRRYSGAAELARDLDNLLARRDIEARAPTAARRLRRVVQRHPSATVGLAAALLLVVGTPTAISFAIAGQRDRARAAEALALRNAYSANLTAAANALQTGNVLEARRRHELCPPEQRGWEWGHLALRLDGSLVTMRGHRAEVTAVALSRDARLAASGARDGEVLVWDTTSGTMLHRLSLGSDEIVAVAFDAAARRVHAADARGAVAVFAAASGERLAALPPMPGFVATFITEDAGAIWRNRGGWRLQELDAETLAVRRELRLDLGAPAPGQRFSVCGRWVLADSGHRLACWELPHGGLARGWVTRSPTGTMGWDPPRELIALAADSSVLILSPQAERPVLQLDAGTQVAALAFGPHGDLLATAGRDGSVRVFDAASGQRLAILHGHTKSVNAIAGAARTIGFLLTGSADHTVKLWSALTAPAVMTLSRHGSVLSVSPDGSRLYSGSHDGSACIWNPASGVPQHFLVGQYHHWVNAVAASPDASTILVGSASRFYVQSAADGAMLGHVDTGGAVVRRCVYSRDGSRIATGHDDGEVRVWDAATRRELHVLRGHASRVRGLTFGPESDVLFSGEENGTVMRWQLSDPPAGRQLLAGRAQRTEGRLFRALALTRDARWLLCAHEDALRSIDPEDGTTRWERPQAERLLSLAIGPDGSRVITGTREGTLTFWNPDVGETMLSFHAHDAEIYALAWDPLGRWCATGGEDGRIRIWRTLEPGVTTRPLDEDNLLVQVALHYCRELVGKEITLHGAQRALAERNEWNAILRAKVRELLDLHGGTGNWPALKLAYDLLRQPRPTPADLQRARTMWEDGRDASTLSHCTEALLLLRSGAVDEAEPLTRRVLASRPPDWDKESEAAVRAVRAIALQRLGRREEAQAELAALRALCQDPDAAAEPNVHAFLAEVEAALGG